MERTKQNLTENRLVDMFVAYRFLRILTTPWEDQEAYKHGIIDENGNLLRKASELSKAEEKASFTLLHRLIFNLKRILHKIPIVKTKLGTYATALYLLKQHFQSQVEEEDTIENAFKDWLINNGYVTEEELKEQTISEHTILSKGKYKLKNGDVVVAYSDTKSVDQILGENIFKVISQTSKQEVYISSEDIKNNHEKV